MPFRSALTGFSTPARSKPINLSKIEMMLATSVLLSPDNSRSRFRKVCLVVQASGTNLNWVWPAPGKPKLIWIIFRWLFSLVDRLSVSPKQLSLSRTFSASLQLAFLVVFFPRSIHLFSVHCALKVPLLNQSSIIRKSLFAFFSPLTLYAHKTTWNNTFSALLFVIDFLAGN